jgi:hypothetical protein
VCGKEICCTPQFYHTFETQTGDMMAMTKGRKSRRMLFKKKRWETGRKELKLSSEDILDNRLPEHEPAKEDQPEKKKTTKKTTAGKKTVKKKKESDK